MTASESEHGGGAPDSLAPGTVIGTRVLTISREMAAAHLFATADLRGVLGAAGAVPLPPAVLASQPWRFPNSGMFMGRPGALNVGSMWRSRRPLAAGDEIELLATIAEHYVRRGREHVTVRMAGSASDEPLLLDSWTTVSWPATASAPAGGTDPSASGEKGDEGPFELVLERNARLTLEMIRSLYPEGVENFHTRAELAQRRGFENAVVAGPHQLALASEAAIAAFGTGWLCGGGLSCRYLRPVLAGTEVTVRVSIPAGSGDSPATARIVTTAGAMIACVGELEFPLGA